MNAAAITGLNIALVGNPNCGKTALFNRLTGGRQKVANYAGVTVERKEGKFTTPDGKSIHMLDLPGTYSLTPASPDEAITRDVCMGLIKDVELPDIIVCVADATNLRLHLRFVLELQQLGRPMILALNLMDEAQKRGIKIDSQALSRELGMPVVETVAVRSQGAEALAKQLDMPIPSTTKILPANTDLHQRVRAMLSIAVTMPEATDSHGDKIDRWVLHPVMGLLILSVVMFLMFQAVFSWAAPIQEGVGTSIAWLGAQVSMLIPDGPLNSLVTTGLFAGLGTVMEFLPQILMLFLFILILEESGYLPRAAFLLDRFMFAAGLTGRSFIPMLSSFACAIPGIMATRSIQDPRDRLATIMVAPLMTCSARLPVYTLLISAFIPRTEVMSIFNLQGLVLFALYMAGIFSAMLVSYVIKKTRKDKSEHALMMELPRYRWPNPRDIAMGLWERTIIFMRRVTGIILSLTVILWFLSSYPSPPAGGTLPPIDYSFAGQIGRFMEPLFAPIGFNWQICVALIPGLAAREVAVAALATVYAISAVGDDAAAQALSPLIAAQWTIPTALSLLVWYVYAPQCLSTLAVIRRETNSWKQVFISAGYLFALAYFASFVTYQLASLWL
ncbi:MAG: ferrous iron transporter B [Arenimonas sp.]